MKCSSGTRFAFEIALDDGNTPRLAPRRCPGVHGCSIRSNGRSELARCQWGDLLWETFCVMLCLPRIECLLVEWVGALLPPNENSITTNWADRILASPRKRQPPKTWHLDQPCPIPLDSPEPNLVGQAAVRAVGGGKRADRLRILPGWTTIQRHGTNREKHARRPRNSWEPS
jgi:hypothetical protein